MRRLELDRDRFVGTMRRQADIGGTDEGGLDRLALTDADRRARDWLVTEFEALDLEVRIDAFGNIFGHRPGRDPDAGTVLIGSHLDSQPDGGVYDGALGVVAALELVRTLEDRGIATERGVEVVDWTNEEGSRFHPAMQGSGVWAGALDIEEEHAKRDGDGLTVERELERIGYRGETPASPRRDYETYLELHVEQGPTLEAADADVGAVTGIVGSRWGAATFRGRADHSGSTPMHARRDALVAAADFITAVRRLPTRLGDRTVATTGAIDVAPDSINVVPETATVTWDVRDPDDDLLDRARSLVRDEAANAARREGIDVSQEDRMRVEAVDFPERTVDAVASAASTLGYDVHRIRSGAGHDALPAAAVCDTGMVFAVSDDGVSHTPDEHTSWDDCYRAANTFATAVLDVAG